MLVNQSIMDRDRGWVIAVQLDFHKWNFTCWMEDRVYIFFCKLSTVPHCLKWHCQALYYKSNFPFCLLPAVGHRWRRGKKGNRILHKFKSHFYDVCHFNVASTKSTKEISNVLEMLLCITFFSRRYLLLVNFFNIISLFSVSLLTSEPKNCVNERIVCRCHRYDAAKHTYIRST